MDIADHSFQEEQSHTDEMVRQARQPDSSHLKPTGHCHNCYEDVDPSKLFCNNVCADQHKYKF